MKDHYLLFFIFLIWFYILCASSLIFFLNGFLLTRDVQPYNSTCLSLKEQKFYTASKAFINEELNILQDLSYEDASKVCVQPRSKIVLLIVDALRYDFTIYNHNTVDPLPYENRLPVIYQMLSKFPKSSRLFKFIADPPTTTMQRIKALTTGSLPTFIDAGSNFATPEINEDNIIDQLLKFNYNSVFMGDDTWASLYPNRFLRSFPFPSFDVWDLDTVDNGVKANIFSELNKTDWNLLIAHFLGVDHCGHRYGPNHREMTRKLGEINDVIQQVIDVLDNNTILMVIGDHGMTATGDHGGESLEETTAAFFLYSKKKLLNLYNNNAKFPENFTVKQVDLVPTIASILGIPIPFQNLGILIFSCLPLSVEADGIYFWKIPLIWLWRNVKQVISYIEVYSKNKNIFTKSYLDMIYAQNSLMQKQINEVDSFEKFLKFINLATTFLEKVRSLCEEIWIQFDGFFIAIGITLLLLTIVFILVFIYYFSSLHLLRVLNTTFLFRVYVSLWVCTTSLVLIGIWNGMNKVYLKCIFGTNMLSYCSFIYLFYHNRRQVNITWNPYKYKDKSLPVLFVTLLFLFNLCGLFSNSFVNDESFVLLFLLVSLIILTVVRLTSCLGVKSKNKKNQEQASKKLLVYFIILSLILLGCLRMSMYFWNCRVEQRWCYGNNEHFFKGQSSMLQWALSVLSLAVVCFIVKTWLKKYGNLTGFSISQVLIKFIPSVILSFTASFWIFQRFSKNNALQIKSATYLALCAYILNIISVLILIVKPICIYVVRHTSSYYNYSEKFIIPNIYNELKQQLNQEEKKTNYKRSTPVVYGLGTVYSTVYIMLSNYIILITSLVLGDALASSAVVMFVAVVILTVMTSFSRIKSSRTLDDLFSIPFETVVTWSILAQYFFYATGHQPAFSNVAWESASIGTSGIFTNNFILGAPIIINTFSSYILMGISLPLILIGPFTMFIAIPSVLTKKNFGEDAKKGELILFEREEVVTNSLFELSCKYVITHIAKVLASMLAATIHCRHLMVWNVFAPKLLFEAVAMVVTLISVLIGYFIFFRINSRVEEIVKTLSNME